jgi:hypothetical protein
MKYSSFYDDVPPIHLHDPLSDFLGAFEEGKAEIGYLDCVKLAGHSCPTVAGAYLTALVGAKALYPDALPQRGGVKIEIKEQKSQGVTGVIGNIIAFVFGASDEGGFKGIGGRFARDHLISYGANIDGEVRLTRVDTGDSVTLSYDPSSVPGDPRMQPLMGKLLQSSASKEEAELFKALWQARVSKILLMDDHSNVIKIK